MCGELCCQTIPIVSLCQCQLSHWSLAPIAGHWSVVVAVSERMRDKSYERRTTNCKNRAAAAVCYQPSGSTTS